MTEIEVKAPEPPAITDEEADDAIVFEIAQEPNLQFVDRMQSAAKDVIRQNGGVEFSSASLRNVHQLVSEDLRTYLIKPFLIWFLWLFLGSVYYACADAFTPAKGFYYAGRLRPSMATVFPHVH